MLLSHKEERWSAFSGWIGIKISSPTKSDWMRMEDMVPDDYRDLCMLCREFEGMVRDYNFRFQDSPFATMNEIDRIYNITTGIVEEYLNLIRRLSGKEEIVKEAKSELKILMGPFIVPLLLEKGEGGAREGLFTKFMVAIDRERVSPGSVLACYYEVVSPIRSFVNSKIYRVLHKAFIELKSDFDKSFVTHTLAKAGTMPKIKKGAERSESKVDYEETSEDTSQLTDTNIDRLRDLIGKGGKK